MSDWTYKPRFLASFENKQSRAASGPFPGPSSWHSSPWAAPLGPHHPTDRLPTGTPAWCFSAQRTQSIPLCPMSETAGCTIFPQPARLGSGMARPGGVQLEVPGAGVLCHLQERCGAQHSQLPGGTSCPDGGGEPRRAKEWKGGTGIRGGPGVQLLRCVGCLEVWPHPVSALLLAPRWPL